MTAYLQAAASGNGELSFQRTVVVPRYLGTMGWNIIQFSGQGRGCDTIHPILILSAYDLTKLSNPMLVHLNPLGKTEPAQPASTSRLRRRQHFKKPRPLSTHTPKGKKHPPLSLLMMIGSVKSPPSDNAFLVMKSSGLASLDRPELFVQYAPEESSSPRSVTNTWTVRGVYVKSGRWRWP